MGKWINSNNCREVTDQTHTHTHTHTHINIYRPIYARDGEWQLDPGKWLLDPGKFRSGDYLDVSLVTNVDEKANIGESFIILCRLAHTQAP